MILFVLLFVTTNLISQEYWSKTFEVYPGNEQVWQMTNRSILIDGIDFLNPGLYIWQFLGTNNEINESGILVRQ